MHPRALKDAREVPRQKFRQMSRQERVCARCRPLARPVVAWNDGPGAQKGTTLRTKRRPCALSGASRRKNLKFW
jgi:hypothetical protein